MKPGLRAECTVSSEQELIFRVATVSRTETALFCYLRAPSSPQCFSPKTARFWDFLFFS